jgi:hypothetical protein
MPIQKDFKRLVRARMKKTGESYTSARARLLERRPKASRPESPPSPPPSPRPADYARLAGMSDAAIKEKTGCTWKRWVDSLDYHRAHEMNHRDIARLVHSKYEIDGWWAQAVTVGYERIRGLRDIGQRRGGGYEASKSKTFAVPVGALYRACADARRRARWLRAPKLTVRTATRDKTLRLGWADGTVVQLYFVPKGEAKSQIAIQHTGLADGTARERMKAYWAERLGALGELLSG